MNTKDLIKIMEEHKTRTRVSVTKSKDCTEFWGKLKDEVYYLIPVDEKGTDLKLRESMESFREIDTLEVLNKKGKILKRFAKHFKEQNGFALGNEVMGILGDKIQYYLSQDTNDHVMDFTDIFDWNDGDFGKSGSCWWNEYKESLPTFENGGGWAVRFYQNEDDTSGIGRTWIYPANGFLVCFNSYGTSRANTSKAIKALFNLHGITLHYTAREVYNSQDNNIPYINGDTGFILYPEPMTESEVESYLNSQGFDLDMEVIEDERETCNNCGTRMDEYEGNYIHDSLYCDRCTSNLFSFCEKCEEYCDRNDVHEVRDHRFEYVCEYCAKRLGLKMCDECDKYSEETIQTFEGNDLCEHCQDGLYHCDKCEEYYENVRGDECPNCEDNEIEETEESVYFHNYNNNDKGNRTFNLIRVPELDGVYIFNMNQIEAHGWSVTHEKSSVRIAAFRVRKQAIKFARELIGLTDWGRDATDISNDSELLSVIRTKLEAYSEYRIR